MKDEKVTEGEYKRHVLTEEEIIKVDKDKVKEEASKEGEEEASEGVDSVEDIPEADSEKYGI